MNSRARQEPDPSRGYDALADEFMAARSGVGTELVVSWAREHLPQSGSVLDLGCGSGIPIAEALTGAGFRLFGVDASPRLLEEFERRLPAAHSACEPVQESAFFHRSFDAVVAIGLLFLLDEADQREIIGRVARALTPGGRFLFSAPQQACTWDDILTGRSSQSLGEAAYEQILEQAGLQLCGLLQDAKGNNYYDAAHCHTR